MRGSEDKSVPGCTPPTGCLQRCWRQPWLGRIAGGDPTDVPAEGQRQSFLWRPSEGAPSQPAPATTPI
ncbi:hypothetical protein GCM10009696_06180 [Kocuria himachalensis]